VTADPTILGVASRYPRPQWRSSLEAIALGPFVPGVHEEDALTEAADKERTLHDGLQPASVQLRRRAREDDHAPLGAGELSHPGVAHRKRV
jgi:hypothetical protein